MWLGNFATSLSFLIGQFKTKKERTMRGILLWLIGIPIPIIILLWLFGVLH